MSDYRSIGRTLRGAGLVVGSIIDPATITNPHIRAHAAEGRLIRTLLEDILRRHRVPTSVFLERNLYATAAQRLGRSGQQMKRAVAELPREASGPCAEEKAAAVAAWLVLLKPPAYTTRPRRRRATPRPRVSSAGSPGSCRR